jgi:hypothetical protein
VFRNHSAIYRWLVVEISHCKRLKLNMQETEIILWSPTSRQNERVNYQNDISILLFWENCKRKLQLQKLFGCEWLLEIACFYSTGWLPDPEGYARKCDCAYAQMGLGVNTFPHAQCLNFLNGLAHSSA